ncbi:MAG: DUF3467 domain-containing protein [Methanocalculus sp.]|uniref:DUF3467 domain-containing protein n=1 Tax=Methanocalculus sp. TaxID=2004547 RepID=UPI00271F7A17|nr:DUF3467 domain-containing protein [Methanocalculus sp.]MDO8841048.1 DUF3467 domain-containing protein [Methanocalculus sp.]MDO9538642.1 DUF3467 domain-containing protein [Methanocalculus sp.]
MEEENKITKPEEKQPEIQHKLTFIQFLQPNKPIAPDIDVVRYSNHVLINLSENDVLFDFLELPGTIRDGELHVRGTRLYLTHEKAKKFHDVLGKLLYKEE